MSGGKILERISIELRNRQDGSILPVYIDIFDNSLSHKWIGSLNDLLRNGFHLEKNYCFLGFMQSERNAEYLCERINDSIRAINAADIGYQIQDHFTVENTIWPGEIGVGKPGRKIKQDKFNALHRYFEDLQGISGEVSVFYRRANDSTRWHIRQLNLLCHEFETWVLSYRKEITAPEWQRPCQLMCWLNAPRFSLDSDDHKLFGIHTIGRPMGGVFVGVNKAVGKHHWEVFQDEGPDSRIDDLTTSTLRGQTEASGDFDIEWAVDPSDRDFMIKQLEDFRCWLRKNNLDPEDPYLTIGHPQIGQVDLSATFGSHRWQDVWAKLGSYLDVWAVETHEVRQEYPYHWDDPEFMEQQIQILRDNRLCHG